MVHMNDNRLQPQRRRQGRPSGGTRGSAARTSHSIGHALGLPFDIARALHAQAASSGLIRKSMLEGRDFERTLAALEQLTLGPWARRV